MATEGKLNVLRQRLQAANKRVIKAKEVASAANKQWLEAARSSYDAAEEFGAAKEAFFQAALEE